jgi:hypothetical protein
VGVVVGVLEAPRLPSNFSPKDQTNPYADYTEKQLYDFLCGVREST